MQAGAFLFRSQGITSLELNWYKVEMERERGVDLAAERRASRTVGYSVRDAGIEQRAPRWRNERQNAARMAEPLRPHTACAVRLTAEPLRTLYS